MYQPESGRRSGGKEREGKELGEASQVAARAGCDVLSEVTYNIRMIGARVCAPASRCSKKVSYKTSRAGPPSQTPHAVAKAQALYRTLANDQVSDQRRGRRGRDMAR